MTGEQAHKYTQAAFVVGIQNIFNHNLIIPFRLINNHAHHCPEMSFSLVKKTTLRLREILIPAFSLDNQHIPLTWFQLLVSFFNNVVRLIVKSRESNSQLSKLPSQTFCFPWWEMGLPLDLPASCWSQQQPLSWLTLWLYTLPRRNIADNNVYRAWQCCSSWQEIKIISGNIKCRISRCSDKRLNCFSLK